MSTLLVKDAMLVATMDDNGSELADCDILIDGASISKVGQKVSEQADEVIDARGCVVIPGLVNTHNHVFQALYKCIPETQQVGFIGWITYLTDLWLRIPPSPDAVYAAALINFGEMLLTGCTISADQHYMYLSGQPTTAVDRTIDAAREIGIRFHPARGCVTLGRSRGGLVPDEITQPESEILQHAQELITKYHDPAPFSLTRIILSPLGPYSDTETIYREMRELAEANPGVHCHTHLHEVSDVDFCLEKYWLRPLEFMERCGWVGSDVLFYHMSTPPPTSQEVRYLAEVGSFVSQCIGSDLRLSYDLAPIRELLDAGANVCLGTTGCASNLGGDILIEMRLTLAAHRMRSKEPEHWLSAREILRMATRGGAEGLGRSDLGSIEPGKAADLAIFDLNRIDMAGQHDPLAALLFQGISHVTKATIVNGRVIARDGRLLTIDQEEAAHTANAWARRLVPTH